MLSACPARPSSASLHRAERSDASRSALRAAAREASAASRRERCSSIAATIRRCSFSGGSGDRARREIELESLRSSMSVPDAERRSSRRGESSEPHEVSDSGRCLGAVATTKRICADVAAARIGATRAIDGCAAAEDATTNVAGLEPCSQRIEVRSSSDASRRSTVLPIRRTKVRHAVQRAAPSGSVDG